MRLQAKVRSVETFAVVIDKSRCQSADEVRGGRLEACAEARRRFFARHSNETVMLVPDSASTTAFGSCRARWDATTRSGNDGRRFIIAAARHPT